MCNRVLLPTDGSDGTERAVEHAIDHGTTCDAALHVLYVVESILFHGPITEEAMHDRFETFGSQVDR
jgi:nucleotide-binding universal stress UspA family protein